MSLNKVFLVGNLGGQPTSRTTKTGHFCCNASIATQKKKKDVYETTWHRLVAWNKTGEILSTCQKGDTIFVEGEIQVYTFEDKEGKKITQFQIIANSILRSMRKTAGEVLGFDDVGFEPGFEGEQGF